MKLLVIFVLFSSVTFAQTKNKKTVPSRTTPNKVVKKMGKMKVLKDKKEADCNAKEKKPVAIIPDAISLSGNTGCSLEEN